MDGLAERVERSARPRVAELAEQLAGPDRGRGRREHRGQLGDPVEPGVLVARHVEPDRPRPIDPREDVDQGPVRCAAARRDMRDLERRGAPLRDLERLVERLDGPKVAVAGVERKDAAVTAAVVARRTSSSVVDRAPNGYSRPDDNPNAPASIA